MKSKRPPEKEASAPEVVAPTVITGESHGYGCGCGGCAGGSTSISETPMNAASSPASSTPTLDMASESAGSEITGGTDLQSAAGGTTVGAVSNSNYTVSAATLQGAADEIGLREWAGLTEWSTGFTANANGAGSVTSANVRVTLSKQMPTWSNKANRPLAERTEWDRFWNALNFHENGHVGIVREEASTGRGFTGAHRLLENHPSSDAQSTMDTLSSSVGDANVAYDATTQHGLTQQTPFGTTVITIPSSAAPAAPAVAPAAPAAEEGA